jgi:hypothetical protein
MYLSRGGYLLLGGISATIEGPFTSLGWVQNFTIVLRVKK